VYKEKLKKALSLIVFLALVLFILDRLTWVFRGNDAGSRETIAEFQEQEDLDVVLYGGSNVLRYFLPAQAWHELGFTSYDYGTSAARLDMTRAFIQQSRKTHKPILYVCDIRALPLIEETDDLRDNSAESSLRNWSDSLALFSTLRWREITDFFSIRKAGKTDILPYYLDIMKYHTNSKALSSEYQWSYLTADRQKSVEAVKGFTPASNNKKHVPFSRPGVVDEAGEMSQAQRKALEGLLDYCDREGLQVAFICCTYIINEKDWLVLNAAEQMIEERGYLCENFNRHYDEIGLDFETDFSDMNHVNYLGAEKYTSYLTRYLTNHFDLPDHRNETGYSQWDEEYEAFLETMQGWKAGIEALVQTHVDAHRAGLGLKEIDTFRKWYSAAYNDNYSVIVKTRQVLDTDDSTWNTVVTRYALERDVPCQAGVWVLKKKTDEEKDVDGAQDAQVYLIGTNGGAERPQDACVIHVGQAGLTIAGEEYDEPEAAVQIIVYDNNYHEVLDNVLLSVDEEGKLRMDRPER